MPVKQQRKKEKVNLVLPHINKIRYKKSRAWYHIYIITIFSKGWLLTLHCLRIVGSLATTDTHIPFSVFRTTPKKELLHSSYHRLLSLSFLLPLQLVYFLSWLTHTGLSYSLLISPKIHTLLLTLMHFSYFIHPKLKKHLLKAFPLRSMANLRE